MKRLIIMALAAALVAACGDNHTPQPAEDGALPPQVDAGLDAPVDAPPTVRTPCLDRPTDLQRPPTGQLPCELIPPGLSISQ